MLMGPVSVFVTTTLLIAHVQSDATRSAGNTVPHMYRYRYESDLSDISASNANGNNGRPVRSGYRVVEGAGYYPSASSFSQSYADYPERYGGHRIGRRFDTDDIIDDGAYYRGGLGHHGRGYHQYRQQLTPHGGEFIDRGYYKNGGHHINDASFQKAEGENGVSRNENRHGYNQDDVAFKNANGNAGSYNDQQGEKRVVEDGKRYSGDEHFNEQGKKGEEKQEKSGHKKGHVIKGFKTSHHKDESGKTEEYFDEVNDEGDNAQYDERSGKFGKQSSQGYNGGHSNDEFKAGGQQQKGHHENVKAISNSNADKGSYGAREFVDKSSLFGQNNGLDKQSLLGHQEQSRFIKEHPSYVPFYA